ncbi:MAG: hypothetical protein HPY75_00455 [Actinobacteria bacterium]|nr:hypothetical protein [Actinomycetota bacterium]
MALVISSFVALSWISWISALLGLFHPWLNFLLALVVMAIALRFLLPVIRMPSCFGAGGGKLPLYIAIILIIAVSFLNYFLFHDSLSGYRDEGIYANDAVYLAHHGNLPFPRFHGYDTRLFLNTAWNAELYGLFGYSGMKLCNVIPFAIALACVFAMVSDLSRSRWAGLFAIALISLSYPFLWYARRTNNEIFFFSTVWIPIYLFFKCLKLTRSFRVDFSLYMVSIPLPAFIRPEGLLVLALGIIGAIYIFLRHALGGQVYPLLAFLLLSALLLASLWGGYELMKTKYGDQFLAPKTAGSGSTAQQALSAAKHVDVPTLYENKPAYTTAAMIRFGFFPALLLIIPFLIYLVAFRETRPFGIFLVLVAMPFAYFYFNPNISFDFPWFLRRFVAVLLPLAFISFSFIAFRLGKIAGIAISAIYLSLTLFISAPVIFHQDHRNVIRHMDEIVATIPSDSKILVDRYTLGDFTLSGPLFFVYDRDAGQVTPWKPVSLSLVGEHRTAYLITNAENWRKAFRGGQNIFDESVNIDNLEIVKEILVPVCYLKPTCEFQRAGNVDTWVSMDYRLALSNIEIPRKKILDEYRVIIIRLELSASSEVEPEGETG